MYTKGIFGTHLYLPVDELQTPIEKLKKKLTAWPKYSELAPISMFDESREGYFGIPRYHSNGLASSVENLTVELNRGQSFEHVFTSTLRDNQFPLYTEFAESVLNGKTGFILSARTGSGKTVILLKFIELIGRSTLVLVPTEGLLLQWRDMIVKHTGYTESDIGHAQADILDYKDKPITIGLVQSVCKDKYGEGFKNNFGVVVIDEVHRFGAYHFSKVVSMFPAMYRIGASGTVSRLDGMETVFLNHMGERIISLGSEREEENRPKILIVGYRGAKKNIPGWAVKLDKVRKRGVIISALAKDNNRNNMLTKLAIKLSLSGRRVLVLSDRIAQLEYMLEGTNAAHKPGLFVSTTAKKEKEAILKNSGIIYATFGMFSTGMDVPDLSGLIFATPQSRVRQAIGRVSRLHKGKKRPVIIDIVDNDIQECTNWYRGRVSDYNHSDVKGTLIVT